MMTIPNYVDLKTDHVFPFEMFGKTWVCYYPGYEGLYAISIDLEILSLEKTLIRSNNKKLKCHYKLKVFINTNKSKKYTEYTLSCYNTSLSNNNNKVKPINKLQLFNILIKKNLLKTLNPLEITFPFKHEEKLAIGWLKGFEGIYIVTDCAKLLSIRKLVNPFKNNFKELKPDISKLKKPPYYEFYSLFKNHYKIRISRNDVLKQSSDILATMTDD